MKKMILPLLAAVVMAMGFTSCEHQTMRSTDIKVNGSDWSKPAGANYYIATFSWDELTEEVVMDGTVDAAIYHNGRLNPLPYVYPIEAGTDASGNPIYVAENIRFQYTYGIISFIVEDLDGLEPENMAQANLSFHVTAIGD